MRFGLITAILLSFASGRLAAEAYATANSPEPALQRESVLAKNGWNHGSIDCAVNEDAAIDVYSHDETTFILRQNKCLSFEAPFIYVLVGASKVLVLDTGATESPSDFPLYQTVQSVVGEETMATKEVLIVHSHSHSDHYKGDLQFKGKPGATLVNPSGDDVKNFFGFREWPSGNVRIELGGRKLTVIPTPGHQEDAITIYDPQTKWLLTGDTVYPGYIYIKDWEDYKRSIARLVSFSASHDVSAILGAHIEMTREPGEYYPIGTTFQPNEAALDLKLEDLLKLNAELQESDEEKELVFDKFIVAPMSGLQKAISNIARWFTQ
jgi:glyoxylase-like metal-dependent hydrolase (beta-lactamase superfamily II)